MLIIRNTTNSDTNALSELAKLCFTDTFGHLYSKANLLNHLEKTCSARFFSETLLHDRILLAEKTTLIGYIKFGEVDLPIESIPKEAKEIHRLYIHPKHKGNGVGRSLMQYALEDPSLKSAEHLYLSVYEDNLPAQQFYQSYGFSVIGEYDYYVGSHIDREFIMHKRNND